jgi:hypothetical protein
MFRFLRRKITEPQWNGKLRLEIQQVLVDPCCMEECEYYRPNGVTCAFCASYAIGLRIKKYQERGEL